jgi:hypothetical protein
MREAGQSRLGRRMARIDVPDPGRFPIQGRAVPFDVEA